MNFPNFYLFFNSFLKEKEIRTTAINPRLFLLLLAILYHLIYLFI